jgi:transposase
MFHVGLDIHSKRIAICVLGETGQIVRRAQVRTIDEMMRILEALPDRFEVCYEASCGYGHYHDLLRPIAARVTVAHPGRLRLIFLSKDKNDRKDAERLAKLLYLGEAPAVHVPSGDVRAWRELVTCRGRVIAKRTRAKNSVRAVLRGAGVVAPGRPALWTKKGLELAPPAGVADGFSAAAAGPAARGDRGADEPVAAHRARVESPGGAFARRRL